MTPKKKQEILLIANGYTLRQEPVEVGVMLKN